MDGQPIAGSHCNCKLQLQAKQIDADLAEEPDQSNPACRLREPNFNESNCDSLFFDTASGCFTQFPKLHLDVDPT